MKRSVEWDGTGRPFDGELSIPVDVIPKGSRVTSARVRVTPVDTGGSFVESITFGASGKPWGANVVQSAQFIEVDFRARRTLAAVRGTGLTGTHLQIDPGGAYVELNDRGAIRSPGDTLFALPAPDAGGRILVPSFVIARFKLTAPFGAGAQLAAVEIRSTPENVSLRLGDDPTFHTFLGQMTSTETSSDFATLLQDFLSRAKVENGFYSVPLVIHSDTIARLKLQIEFDVLQENRALPAGVQESVLDYSFDAIPVGAAASLPLSLPPGARAVPGATSIHFQGSFDDSRIAYGPIVPEKSTVEAEISSAPGGIQAQAQQFTLPRNLAVTGIDLLLSASTLAAQVQVDVRDDLGGKPGLASVLPVPLLIDLTTQPSGKPNWVSVSLPAEVQLSAQTAYWLVVQRSLGDAQWAVRKVASLAMQQTTDGGLSWRQSSASPIEGLFRLRNRPAQFTMPIHVFAGEGAAANEVPLKQFESLGRVDFTLDTGGLADAINNSLEASSTQKCNAVEHLDNREFEDWLRIGQTASPARTLPNAALEPLATAVAPDGTVLYILDLDNQGVPTLRVVDPICGNSALPLTLPGQTSEGIGNVGMTITPDGKRLVACLNAEFWLIDLVKRVVIGDTAIRALQSIATPSATNERLYFSRILPDAATKVYEVEIRSVEFSSLENHLETGAALPSDTAFRFIVAKGSSPTAGTLGLSLPAGLAVPPDEGHIYLLENDAAAGGRRIRVLSPLMSVVEKEILLEFLPAGIALHPDGRRAFVGDSEVNKLHQINLATGARLETLSTGEIANTPIAGLSMAAFADGLIPVLERQLDSSTNTLKLIEFGIPMPEVWQITAPGKVRPICMEEPFRIAAGLGDSPDPSAQPSSISQVVPVSAGCIYEFSYWGVASADGAVGEILWRTGDCASPRKDALPIQVLDMKRSTTLDSARFTNLGKNQSVASRLKFHRLRVQSPEGATAAEVRFRTTFGMAALVDRASLRTVDVTLSNGDFLDMDTVLPKQWRLVPETLPGFAFTRVGEASRLVNNGIQTAALTQRIAIKPSTRIHIEFEGESVAAKDPPFLQVVWINSASGPAVMALQPGAPRLRVADIDVPGDATEADFTLQLPPESSLTTSALRVLSDSRLAVPINVYAEAPGELTVSRVNVVTDKRPVTPRVAPPGGICPVTPPGDDPSGEDCGYCCECEGEQETKATEIVRSPAGRTSIQYYCVKCQTTMIRSVPMATLSNAPVTNAVQPLLILRKPIQDLTIRARSIPAITVPPDIAVTRTQEVALNAAIWIPTEERRKLESVGIRSLQALATAPESLAFSALGSETRARQFITRARNLMIKEP